MHVSIECRRVHTNAILFIIIGLLQTNTDEKVVLPSNCLEHTGYNYIILLAPFDY